jgi:hypothetical protein
LKFFGFFYFSTWLGTKFSNLESTLWCDDKKLSLVYLVTHGTQHWYQFEGKVGIGYRYWHWLDIRVGIGYLMVRLASGSIVPKFYLS